MSQFRRNSFGQNMSEILIVIALVAIVGIPAFMLMGGSINDGLKWLSGLMNGTSTFDSQAALAYKPVIPKAGDPGAQAPQGVQESTGQGVTASINPKSGVITYDLPEMSGGGTNTASVEGASVILSNRLLEIANTWKDSTGQPLDPSLQRMIRELAAEGFNLGGVQEQILAYRKGKTLDVITGPNIVDGSDTDDLNEKTVEAQASAFTDKYNTLLPVLEDLAAQSTEHQELKTIVDQYSGIISQVNYLNFMENHNTGAEKKFTVGTTPTITVSKEDSPTVTNISAEIIQSTANSTTVTSPAPVTP